MQNRFKNLKRRIGEEVVTVIATLWFYQLEQVGSVGNLKIKFASGPEYMFVRSRNGGIFVTRPSKSSSAFDLVPNERPIDGLVGKLSEIKVGKEYLRLEVGGITLVVANFDDEIEVSIDRAKLPKEFFNRVPMLT